MGNLAQAQTDDLDSLLELTAAGDRTSFAQLYRLTSGRILAVVLRLVGNRAVAEDVLQEAYVTVWRKAGQYRAERGVPLAWMTTIARNKAIDRLRTDAAKGRNQEEWTDKTAIYISQIEAAQELPRHLTHTVRRCVEALEMNYRKAVLLAYYYGMSHEELAKALETPLGTVKSWVRRALLQLKVCIDQ